LNRARHRETAPLSRITGGQIRCAIYTRKSTDEGLDQEFNSLSAQREAAEAFITSQRGEGLVALPQRYDDGGFSGGSLDRPALKHLLEDIRDGSVGCVVVYKVDRLSRSLIDFARIIEIFEKHNVSFVSVTQQFNTTNSLGRLTLNILLSFAQFEREIIAERTRDKMSAARRRGKWTGGRPVLGYDIDPHSKRLIINRDEAVRVCAIFQLYAEYNSLVAGVREIDRRGWRTKDWVTRRGVMEGGKPFTKGRLFRLLTNPIYIGKIDFKNETYEGEHDAIVDSPIWEETQRILQRNSLTGGLEVRGTYSALLKGLLRCASCQAAMTRIYAVKNSQRIPHYTCPGAHQRDRGTCDGKPVSESSIKAFVTRQIRRIGSDPRIVTAVMAKANEYGRGIVAGLSLEHQVAQRELARMGTKLRELLPNVGCDEQTISAQMADLHKRIDRTEHRSREILRELRSLEGESVQEADVRVVLAEFDPLWKLLNSREQVRIVCALVESVVYNGKTNRVTVGFRSQAVRRMCRGRGRST
jgi:site-specific DNA recombinase